MALYKDLYIKAVHFIEESCFRFSNQIQHNPQAQGELTLEICAYRHFQA